MDWPVTLGDGARGGGCHGGPGEPAGVARLRTGIRFDVLDVPLGAGLAVLRRLPTGETGPVAAGGRRVAFLVEPGSCEELPGLLDWLDWGGIALDIAAVGRGGSIVAPAVPGPPAPERGPWEAAGRALPVWVRPPLSGCADRLPSVGLSGTRGAQSPDLARLVATVADACHRARLFPRLPAGGGADGQAWALS